MTSFNRERERYCCVEMLQRNNKRLPIGCNYTIDQKQRFDSIPTQSYLVIVRRGKSAAPEVVNGDGMKAMEFNIDNKVFGGLVGVIADSLGRKPGDVVGSTAKGRTSRQPASRPSPAAGQPPASSPGALERLGRWFLRHQTEGVGAEIARSRDIFESLDRWLWKQQMRETEAYLAQSSDIFELEARMRRLERGPSHT